MKKISILGGGETAMGAALLAKKMKYEIFVSAKDLLSPTNKLILQNNNIQFEEGKHTLSEILDCNFIIKSPGISNKSELMLKIQKEGRNIISDIEFAYKFIEGKIIAITGTNGKTTVTSLLGHICKNAGLNISVSGNIGNSICREILEKDFDIYIIEISSFQLENIQKFKPNIALILNIQRDHLEEYDYDIYKYAHTKMSLLKNMDLNDYAIIPQNDELINNQIDSFLTNKIYINTNLSLKNFYIQHGLKFEDLHLKGKHNLMNILFCTEVAKLLNVDSKIIINSLKSFHTLRHRLQYVNSIDNINFYNDSKATTLDSVLAALNSFNKKVIWIAGGIDKGNDYLSNKAKILNKVKYLIYLGKNSEKLKKMFPTIFYNESNSLPIALKQAYEVAKNGDIILFSPGGSSFDLFKNFENRGDEFIKEVNSLKNQLTI